MTLGIRGGQAIDVKRWALKKIVKLREEALEDEKLIKDLRNEKAAAQANARALAKKCGNFERRITELEAMNQDNGTVWHEERRRLSAQVYKLQQDRRALFALLNQSASLATNVTVGLQDLIDELSRQKLLVEGANQGPLPS